MEINSKKNSGVKWDFVKIKDLIYKPISGEWGDGEGEINVIRTTNFTNDGKLDLNELVQRNIDPRKSEQKKLNYGDTIIEKSGGSPTQPVGRVVFFDQSEGVYLCNNFTSVIRAKSELDPRYLFWFLFHNHLTKNTLKYQNKTTGIINLQLERYIDDLLIPLPPLSTQKRIAEILDAADALRRKDQELLKKYDALAQAIFIDMFGDPVKNEKGWEVSFLEDLCEDIVDCPHTTPIHSEEITLYPCIRTSEMKNGRIFWGSMKYLSHQEYLIRIKRLTPRAGDIVYAREGTYGQAVILPKNQHFALGQRTMLLRPNSIKVNNQFLWFQINSEFVYQQAKRKNMGSTVGHVNVADVKKFIIYCPPIDLQNRFENQLFQIQNGSHFLANYKSESLFHSLLQQAFNGEL